MRAMRTNKSTKPNNTNKQHKQQTNNKQTNTNTNNTTQHTTQHNIQHNTTYNTTQSNNTYNMASKRKSFNTSSNTTAINNSKTTKPSFQSKKAKPAFDKANKHASNHRNRNKPNNSNNNKNNSTNRDGIKPQRKKAISLPKDDLLIESDDEEVEPHTNGTDDLVTGAGGVVDDDPYAYETPDERRVRLTKAFLKKIEADERRKSGIDEDEDEEEEDSRAGNDQDRREFKELERQTELMNQDPIARRLMEDALRQKGILQKKLAARFVPPPNAVDGALQCKMRLMRGHSLSVTCVALTEDERSVFSGSKDGTLIHWDVETGKKLFVFKNFFELKRKQAPRSASVTTITTSNPISTPTTSSTSMSVSNSTSNSTSIPSPDLSLPLVPPAPTDGHKGDILSVAVSTDGTYVVSSGEDKSIRVWDTRSHQLVKTLTGHRGPVSCLVFRANTHELFSGSYDRTVKLWNLDQMSYVETLFGHQSEIHGIDSLFDNRTLTCGQDKTVRLWKIVDGTQLL